MRLGDCLKNAFCSTVTVLIGDVEHESDRPFRLELGRKLLNLRQRVLEIPECRADLNLLQIAVVTSRAESTDPGLRGQVKRHIEGLSMNIHAASALRGVIQQPLG